MENFKKKFEGQKSFGAFTNISMLDKEGNDDDWNTLTFNFN